MKAAILAALLGAGPSPEAGPVLVVPPEGKGGTAPGWIGAAVSVTLPRALQRAGVPVVPDLERRRAQQALGVSAAALTRATSLRVAESLGASRLVVGSWEVSDGSVTLALRLVDPGRGSLSSPLVGTVPLASLGTLVHHLAWDVALAGPSPPSLSREALDAAAAAVPFEALRALGEGMAARGAAAQAAGARRALASHPGYEEARLVLAGLLADASDYRGALETLASISPGSAFSRDARFLEGAALLGLTRYREADVLYAELARGQESAAVLGNRAVARLRGGGGGASVLLRQALEVEPASVDLPFNLGWALLVEGDPKASSFWLRGAVRRDPADAQGRLLLSWALEQAGRGGDAEEQWRAAVALTPSLERQRAPDPARRLERVFASEHGLLLDPDREGDAEAARAHALRGEALIGAGELDQALTELSRAALLDPYAPLPHRLLARAHAARGEADAAIEALRQALWCREDPEVRRELAARLQAAGRTDEAKAILSP